jgi:hypothetical protein
MNKENLVNKESAEYSNYDFLNDLYQKIYDWEVEDQGGKVIGEFDKQRIKWDSLGDNCFSTLNVTKGVAIRDEKKDFVLVLGQGNKARNEPFKHMRLMFALVKKDNKDIDIYGARDFFNWLWFDGKGEFFTGINNDIRIDCSSAGSYYWRETLKDEGLRDEKNLNECLEIVKRVANNLLENDSLLIKKK